MTHFNSRSEMRRLAIQAPDKLVKHVEEQDKRIEELVAEVKQLQAQRGEWQDLSLTVRNVTTERDEARLRHMESSLAAKTALDAKDGQLAVAIKALEYYASLTIYANGIAQDQGERAREALAKLGVSRD